MYLRCIYDVLGLQMAIPCNFQGQVCSPNSRRALLFILVRRERLTSRRWSQYVLLGMASCCSLVLVHAHGGKSLSINSAKFNRPDHNSPSKYSSGETHRTSDVSFFRSVVFKAVTRRVCFDFSNKSLRSNNS